MNKYKLATIRYTIATVAFIGFLIAASGAGAAASGSLPAILFGLAGVGFAGVLIYYIFVHDEVENNK